MEVTGEKVVRGGVVDQRASANHALVSIPSFAFGIGSVQRTSSHSLLAAAFLLSPQQHHTHIWKPLVLAPSTVQNYFRSFLFEAFNSIVSQIAMFGWLINSTFLGNE